MNATDPGLGLQSYCVRDSDVQVVFYISMAQKAFTVAKHFFSTPEV